MQDKGITERELNARHNPQKRVEYVDLYRGIGIILMIMAHIGFGSMFDHYIHAFHMPMFFFVSGYFFKLDSAEKFFKQKMKTLLVPYVFYASVIYFGCSVLYGKPEDSLTHTLLYMSSTKFIAAALWFLTALFVANAVYWLIQTPFKSYMFISLAVFLIALCGNLIHFFFEKPCIFAFDAGLVGVGIMHFGYICRNCRNQIIEKAMNLKWGEIIFTIAMFNFLIFANGKVNMREGNYGILPLFWINAIGMCIVLWNVARKLQEIRSIKLSRNRIIDLYSIIKNIGRRSLVFLCLNQVMIAITFKLIHTKKSAHGIAVLIHNTVVLFIVLAVLYLIAIIRETVKDRIINQFIKVMKKTTC